MAFLQGIEKKLKDYCFEGGPALTFGNAPKEVAFLRNHYLHWNSTYGEEGVDVAVQTNYPNKDDNGKRKRHVR